MKNSETVMQSPDEVSVGKIDMETSLAWLLNLPEAESDQSALEKELSKPAENIIFCCTNATFPD